VDEVSPKRKNNRAKLAVIFGVPSLLLLGIVVVFLYSTIQLPDTSAKVSKRNRLIITQAVNEKDSSICGRIQGNMTASDLKDSTDLPIVESRPAASYASAPDKTESEAQNYCRILVDISKSE